MQIVFNNCWGDNDNIIQNDIISFRIYDIQCMETNAK
jgi:hypothetical protein